VKLCSLADVSEQLLHLRFTVNLLAAMPHKNASAPSFMSTLQHINCYKRQYFTSVKFLVLFLVCESADRIQMSSVTVHPRALLNPTGAADGVWVGQILDQPCSYEQFKMDASRLDRF
jgi:hypothetical protein